MLIKYTVSEYLPHGDKIQSSVDSLVDTIKGHRRDNRRIVFTNGCFDILHIGHVNYLQASRELGEVLIVGINSSESVERNKGRMCVNSLHDRMQLLSALESVDYVIPFYEDTPINLIDRLKPDILTKGYDYKHTEIVGYDEVLESGGKIVTIVDPDNHNQSTTNIINKIIGMHNDNIPHEKICVCKNGENCGN